MKNIVYHGSSNGNIEVLKAHKSTHQKNCIYATDNKVVALLFACKGNRDLDTRISNVNGKPELIERRPGVLKALYDKSGFLYELDGSSFNHYDYLWSLEVISFENEIKPLNKIYYPNVLDAIIEEEKKGNLILYRYPNRPANVPLDNSDLIEKYIKFKEKGQTCSVLKLLNIYPEFSEILKEKGYDIENKDKVLR